MRCGRFAPKGTSTSWPGLPSRRATCSGSTPRAAHSSPSRAQTVTRSNGDGTGGTASSRRAKWRLNCPSASHCSRSCLPALPGCDGQAGLPLDPRAPAAGDVGELFQRDLARVAHRAHEHRAVGDAEVDALLRLGAGEETVGEAGGEPVAAADAVFDLDVLEARAVVEFSVGPHDGGPIVDRRRLHAAERRADDLDVRIILYDALDHLL